MSARKLDTDVSKFMSYALRHAPQEAGLTLDNEGWANFAEVVRAVRARFDVSEDDLKRIVAENPKQRFTLEGDRIRAAQGHSVAVDIGLEPSSPPPTLFHGTQVANLAAIMDVGLKKMQRQHVHLSIDAETAEAVARRRKGKTTILRIDAGRMHSNGGLFFLSDNGVWLTETVKPEYISAPTETEI